MNSSKGFKRYGAVFSLTLTGQILSGISLLIMSSLGNGSADRLSMLLQVGLVPLGGVALGVVYNLAIGRPKFFEWGRWSLFSLFVAGIAALVFAAGNSEQVAPPYWPNESWKIIELFIFGLGGAALGLAGILGVRFACQAKPNFLAGIMILPSAGLCIGIGASHNNLSLILPGALWFSGSIATLGVGILLLKKSKVSKVVIAKDQIEYRNREYYLQLSSLIATLVSSAFMPIFYSLALLGLASGSIYFALMVSRLATAGINLFVNSYLNVSYFWGSPEKKGQLIELTSALGFIALSFASLLGNFFKMAEQAQTWTFILGWFLSLIGSSMLIRELNARRMGKILAIKTGLELLLNLGVLGLLLSYPSLVGFFAAIAASQMFTIFFGGVALKSKRLIASGCLGVAVSIAVILVG